MDHKEQDKKFFANFSFVMAGLFAIFFVCIVVARMLVGGSTQADPAAVALVGERIKPIGSVVTDPAALVKVAAPAAAPRAPMTGEQVNTKLCAGCHMAGVLGAPKTGDKASWAGRLGAVGMDGLVSAAIKGKNAMPPKGGDPSLSDEEVRAALEYMLKQSGV